MKTFRCLDYFLYKVGKVDLTEDKARDQFVVYSRESQYAAWFSDFIANDVGWLNNALCVLSTWFAAGPFKS